VSVEFDLELGFEQPDRPLFVDAVQYEILAPGGVRWEFPAGRVEPSGDEGDEAS